jgi:tetratricopeptide (TPR) repeat protein
MKPLYVLALILFICSTRLFAQNNDLLLARQYAANGEQQKALDIYQKLFKQDNETYYQQYFSTLISFKKYDDAESITKKMLRKYPGNNEYIIALGSVYTQQGNTDKAESYIQRSDQKHACRSECHSRHCIAILPECQCRLRYKIFLQGRKLFHNDAAFAFELITLYRYKRDKVPPLPKSI